MVHFTVRGLSSLALVAFGLLTHLIEAAPTVAESEHSWQGHHHLDSAAHGTSPAHATRDAAGAGPPEVVCRFIVDWNNYYVTRNEIKVCLDIMEQVNSSCARNIPLGDGKASMTIYCAWGEMMLIPYGIHAEHKDMYGTCNEVVTATRAILEKCHVDTEKVAGYTEFLDSTNTKAGVKIEQIPESLKQSIFASGLGKGGKTIWKGETR